MALGGLHRLRRLDWFVRRPGTRGAHAIAFTIEGRLILVRLRYASGWRLPGGGRDAGEDPCAAALRELREEIGMVRHGPVRLAAELVKEVDYKRDLDSLVVVRDVEYRPRWSLEVEEVGEFAPDRLPADLADHTAWALKAVSP